MARKRDRAAFMISVVSEQYEIHPQTLRLYEREGLLKPSRTEGNTRLYTEKDLERLEVILSLTRDLGVNLAGVEIILNMREKMEAMQLQMQEFISCLSQQMSQAQTPPPSPDDSGRALVPLARRSPADHQPRMNANRRK
jgi:MerR family transcriptional regulator/heat shock protein HspR